MHVAIRRFTKVVCRWNKWQNNMYRCLLALERNSKPSGRSEVRDGRNIDGSITRQWYYSVVVEQESLKASRGIYKIIRSNALAIPLRLCVRPERKYRAFYKYYDTIITRFWTVLKTSIQTRQRENSYHPCQINLNGTYVRKFLARQGF